MALTETQSWDDVLAGLSSRSARRVQPNEPLLRVVRHLRDQAARTFELYPEVDGSGVNVYDTEVYDATFHMRRLSVQWVRNSRGFEVRHVLSGGGKGILAEAEWLVPEAEIEAFLLDRLRLLDWRTRS